MTIVRKLSERSPVPAAAVDKHVAVLGKTGSGKSYAIRGVVEELLEQSQRVCVIDPTGVWYGLRTLADGKRAGYPVAIFGGQHGDFPLAGHHGEELAEIVGTSSTPAIIDTSLLRTGERVRLFTDLADGLLRKNRGPLHLVIDEAHLFAPQGRVSDPQSGQMLHAANNLVSLGRSRGLRIVLITQRPAKLHKDSLSQVETLIALRLIAPQDRRAVEDWIEDNADEKTGAAVLSSLASLKTGTGWIWAPEIGVLEKVAFPRIRTLDSGRAPDGSDVEGRVLAEIDRDAIAARLKAVAQEAIDNDPKRLRARIADLERELRKPRELAVDVVAIERATRSGFRSGFDRVIAAHNEYVDKVESWLGKFPRPDEHAKIPARPIVVNVHSEQPVAAATQKALLEVAGAAQRQARQVNAVSAATTSTSLPRGEAAVLTALIQYPTGLERSQLTVLTGYKRSSRDTYLQKLRERGLIEVAGDRVRATDAGRAALPGAEPLPTGRELQEFWYSRLPTGERAILQHLVSRYPAAVPRDELSEVTGYKRSSRDTYLQKLAAKELIDEPQRGMVRAADALVNA